MSKRISQKHRKAVRHYAKAFGLLGLVVISVICVLFVGFISLVAYFANIPSARSMLGLDTNEVAAALPIAKREVQSQFSQYGFNLTQAVDTSSANLCFWTDARPELLSRSYDKNCAYRMTAFYQITSDFSQTLATFEATHNVGDARDSTMYTLNDAPCTVIASLQTRPDVNVDFCPKNTSVDDITKYIYTRANNVSDYELRGFGDSTSLPTDNSGPSIVLSEHLYNLAKDINTAYSNQLNGFIIIGVTDQYFTGNDQYGGF